MVEEKSGNFKGKFFGHSLKVGFSMLFLCFFFHVFIPSVPVFPKLTIIGGVLWISGSFFWLIGLIHLGKYGLPMKGNYMETNYLVDKGVFSLLRHPQYFGFILFALGFIFLSQNIWIILLALMSIVFIALGCVFEDAYLRERFGSETILYQKRVPGLNIFLGLWRFLIKDKN